MTRYPNTPAEGKTDTSAAAAEKIRPQATRLRDAVYEQLRVHGEATADELAANMNRSILSIRPRVTELHAQGRIEDTGRRKKNPQGNTCIIWRAKDE